MKSFELDDFYQEAYSLIFDVVASGPWIRTLDSFQAFWTLSPFDRLKWVVRDQRSL